MVGAFDKDNNLTGLHMRISGQSILATVFPSRMENGKDPVTFQGLNPSGENRVRLQRAEPADRPCHAQSARSGGLLARRERQPQRDLRRVLHGRARAFDRRGRAGIPAQADDQAPEESRGAQCRRREDRLGQAAAARPSPRPVADDGVRQLRGRRAEISVEGDKIKIHRSSARPIRASPSTRRRSTGRSRARSSTASRRCSTANAPSRTAPSSRPTSTPTTRSASRRCRRWRSIIMPSGHDPVGWRRRADHPGRGAGRAQRLLQRRRASASARSR